MYLLEKISVNKKRAIENNIQYLLTPPCVWVIHTTSKTNRMANRAITYGVQTWTGSYNRQWWGVSANNKYTMLMPSMHILWNLWASLKKKLFSWEIVYYLPHTRTIEQTTIMNKGSLHAAAVQITNIIK